MEHFYPRSPCGERRYSHFMPNSGTLHFYPRSPCGERPGNAPTPVPLRYFYPRSPCGERHPSGKMHYMGVFISIHALLAESDCRFAHHTTPYRHFYPRSPCGERLAKFASMMNLSRFLSTLSLRRATYNAYETINRNRISIHALLAESDACA